MKVMICSKWEEDVMWDVYHSKTSVIIRDSLSVIVIRMWDWRMRPVCFVVCLVCICLLVHKCMIDCYWNTHHYFLINVPSKSLFKNLYLPSPSQQHYLLCVLWREVQWSNQFPMGKIKSRLTCLISCFTRIYIIKGEKRLSQFHFMPTFNTIAYATTFL